LTVTAAWTTPQGYGKDGVGSAAPSFTTTSLMAIDEYCHADLRSVVECLSRALAVTRAESSNVPPTWDHRNGGRGTAPPASPTVQTTVRLIGAVPLLAVATRR
jgi:hypothetical protein